MTIMTDKALEAFIQTAANCDLEGIQELVGESRKLMVIMFSLYILFSCKNHQDCEEEDCNFLKKVPHAVDLFIDEITKDIRKHVEMNLAVNGITLLQTHNEKLRAELLARIENGE